MAWNCEFFLLFQQRPFTTSVSFVPRNMEHVYCLLSLPTARLEQAGRAIDPYEPCRLPFGCEKSRSRCIARD